MTRENLVFVRQLTEMARSVDDAEHAASREIGSADRVVEEGVAGEGYVLCLAIEGDGTAAVARSGDEMCIRDRYLRVDLVRARLPLWLR